MQVLLWDHRAAASGPVSRFTVPPPAPAAAASMVTCLDAAGSTLLCGTTSQLVTQWDLRRASFLQLSCFKQGAATKLACGVIAGAPRCCAAPPASWSRSGTSVGEWMLT